MIHAVVTLFLCVGAVFLKLNWVAMAIPVAFYVGREIAQAEYRYIEKHGGTREKCPWYCGLVPEAWTVKSALDCLLPAAVAIIAMVAVKFLNG